MIDGQEVIIHYDDIPESDVTTVDGLRCTTPLRTVIDLASQVDRAELAQMVQECVDRGLFTPQQALERVAQPDIRDRLGARRLRDLLGDPDPSW